MRITNWWSKFALSSVMLVASISALGAQTAQVSFTTTTPLTVPTRSNYAGINMQLFNSGVSYQDANMQSLARSMNLGWTRFPAGTEDDVYNWNTGGTPDSWIAQFSAYNAYSDMLADAPIIRGKASAGTGTNGVQLKDFTNFITTQGTGTSPTHVIGVINTFTDSTTSAANLVSAAVAAGIVVDVWELGNEPVYFSGFYPNATTYLNAVKPYEQAIKNVVPSAKVAVWVDPSSDKWTKDVATYANTTGQFWDQIYTHSYPDASQYESNQTDQISWYNGFLLYNSNNLVDTVFEPLFTNTQQFEWSEYNTGNMKSGLYNADFIAEFAMRLSADANVTHAGMHMLVGPTTQLQLAVGTTNDHSSDCVTAYNNGTTINTSSLNFGYFLEPSGLAMEIINGPINTSTGLWPTTVANSNTVSYISGSTTGTMPAIYAQAYKYSGTTHHVLLTNKAGASQQVEILQDGVQVISTFTTRSIGGTSPTKTNTSSSPNNVTLTTGTYTGGTVTVPAYGVMDVSW